MQWIIVNEKLPNLEVWVIVFRSKNEKYIIAKLSEVFDEDRNIEKVWHTQHGNIHHLNDEDMWYPFTNIIVKKHYVR
jgi:hypothetical protein